MRSVTLVAVCVLAALVLVSADASVHKLRARLHQQSPAVVLKEEPALAAPAYDLFGFDFAYGSGVTTDQIKAAGGSFVCRYLSGGSSKDIDALELSNYEKANIKVVLNWETTGQETSYAQGQADARGAQAEAEKLGKGTAPLYFSADFDPVGHETEILDYMRGVASIIGKSRTGLYGGYAAMKAYFDAGIGTFGWQTYAWSNGAWDSRAQLQQYQNDAKVGPATVDRDRTTAANFGQCN